MKKFNLCLLILILFGAFVFYTGWTQRKVDADKIGVVMSKTNGICETPVIPGEFNWHWQFLLPTNAKLKQFTIEPVNTTKTIRGQLPSGDLYTSIFSSPDSFSYYFTFSLSVTLSPQAVVDLYKENKISNDEDLKTYILGACDSIAQLSADYYLSKSRENPNFNIEKIRRDDVIRAIQTYKEYPELEISTFALTESKVPDYNLYSRLQYQGLNQNQIINQTNEEETNIEKE